MYFRFVCIFSWLESSFLFYHRKHPIVWMYQFVYPLTYRRTSWWFPVFGECKQTCGCRFFVSTHLGKYQGAQMLDHAVRLCLSEWVKSLSRVRLFATPWTVAYQAPLSLALWKITMLSSKIASPFCIPTSREWAFQVLCILSGFGIISFLDFSHSRGYAVVFHCLTYRSLTCNEYCPLYFDEESLQTFCSLLHWAVCFLTEIWMTFLEKWVISWINKKSEERDWVTMAETTLAFSLTIRALTLVQTRPVAHVT